MNRKSPLSSILGKPLWGTGALCLVLLLSACGGDDDDSPANPGGDAGTPPPAVCTTAHCAPAP
ncbi:hypothetical protein [Bordetella sp. 2513F-2]